MDAKIENLLLEYVANVKKIYANALACVILYGSYARGDYNSNSDIDVMVLVDSDFNARFRSRDLSFMTYDFNAEHNTDIQPMVRSVDYFRHWNAVHPFYRNVKREGVWLYGAA